MAAFGVGTYKNELGSIMEIKSFDGVTFFGIYRTAVSAKGTSLESTVSGIYNESETKGEGTISFAVNWKYVKDDKTVFSTSSWNGIARADGHVYAMWLVTRYCPSSETWNATTVGSNTFEKISS